MKGLTPTWSHRLRRLTAGDSLRVQLLRGGVGSLAVKATNAVLGFALAIVLARALGPEGYGVYSFALAIVMLAAIPAQVGVPQLVVRETAKAQAKEDWGLMRGLWRWANRAVIIFSFFGAIATGAVLWLMDHVEGGRAATMGIGVALIPLIALANVRAACLRGLRMVVWGQLPESIFRPALLLLFAASWITILAGDAAPTPSGVMVLHVAAAVVTFLLGGLMLWKARPEGITRQPTPRHESNDWRKAVIPFAMMTGLQLINNYADLIILGIFRSDEEVGIYRVVMQFALLVAFGLHIIGKVIQPYLAVFHEASEFRKTQELVSASTAIVLIYGVFVAALFFFFGGYLLTFLFGPSYGAGWLALAILSVGKLFHSGMGIAWHVLNMSGHQHATFKIAVLAVAVNLIMNLMLIPIFGMEGAAVGTTIAFAVFFVVIIRSVERLTNVNVSVRSGSIFGLRRGKE